MTASAAKRASVVKETNGAVISTKGISTQTTVCTRDATRAVMRSHRIIWGDPNLASVRRAHLGTLTSTDKHIQPSRSSLAAMILWGAACLTTCATSAQSMYAMSASTYYCSNLQAAGDDSWSGDGGWSCLSGVSLGGYCCAEGATVPSNGDCCTHCAQGTGTCAARSTCSPCDASGAIENGIASPCTSSLAAGASCEPTCNGGYTLTGSRSCDGQNLADTAACNAISCDPDYYVEDNDGACTPCPAHSTSDRAGSSYCVCDGGYRAVKLADAWLCAACEGAVGSRIPQENGEDAVCASAVRFAAEESREALLDDIADERQKNKAKPWRTRRLRVRR